MSSTPDVRTRPGLVGRRDSGVLVGAGAAVVVVATVVAAAIPPAHSAARFAVVAVAVGAFAALTRNRLAVVFTTALAWLLVNGFLVDRFGELSWHGRADLVRALMLVGAAALGQVAGWPTLSNVDEGDERDV
jgi:hypothetical protein